MSKAEIKPIRVPITPTATAIAPQSLMSWSVFIAASGAVFKFINDLKVKNKDVNKQIRMSDINMTPPSINRLMSVVPISPVMMAIALIALRFMRN